MKKQRKGEKSIEDRLEELRTRNKELETMRETLYNQIEELKLELMVEELKDKR